MNTLVYIVTEDWYFRSHRLPIAVAAMRDGFDVHLIARESNAAAELREHGITTHNFDIGRGTIDVRNHVPTIANLRSLLSGISPQIIHNVAMKPVIYGSLAARKLNSPPVVVNALGGLGYIFTSSDLKARLLRPPAQTLLRLAINGTAGALILQNDDDRRLMVGRKLVSPHKVRMVRGSGVDTHAFAPAPSSRVVPVVAFAGRFLVEKGLHEFIGAVAAMRARQLRARFVLIGGPDADNPNSVPLAQIQSVANQHDIELWGWRTDMADTLRSIDIMVLPSYREGLPKSLIEAASAGIPIVTTDAPGCRDVVVDGETGFLVPVRNVDRLAGAIEGLVKAPELRRTMGDAGRRRAETLYSVDDVVRRTLAIYHEELNAWIRK